MPVHALKVFISAATRDLGSFRESVRTQLDKKDASVDMVIDWQQGFGTGHTSIPDKLYERVSTSDVVIHIAGFACGDRVKQPVSGFRHAIPAIYSGCPSYTQLEYLVARDLGKVVYLCIATDETRLDPAPAGKSPESTDDIAMQEAHRQHLMHGDLHERHKFATREELISIIANIPLRHPEVPPARRPCNLDGSLGVLFKGREQFLDRLRDTPAREIPGPWSCDRDQFSAGHSWNGWSRQDPVRHRVRASAS